MVFETKATDPIDLDPIDLELVDHLATHGRTSYRELGELVALSAPAVADRIRKLEAAGVITGYRAVIDYERLGFPLLAVVRLNAPRKPEGFDEEFLPGTPEIIEANRVTGADSHVVRARLRSTGHLENLLQRFWEYGDSETHIVTSSPVPRRPMLLRRVFEQFGK